MSDLITNLNTLTTKVAALRTKVKAKAVASDATVADTDTISQIVDKIVAFSKIKLTDTYKLQNSLNDFVSNFCQFVSMPGDMSSYFSYLRFLVTVPEIDTSKSIKFYQCFAYCDKLTTVKKLDTSNATNIQSIFYACGDNLVDVPELDLAKVTNMMYIFWGCHIMSVIKLKNLGTQPSVMTSGAFDGTIWGQGSDKARQSLVDSLLTNSFNRATAGYSALTIQLMSKTLALLTDTEKAAITAKGYTLTAY